MSTGRWAWRAWLGRSADTAKEWDDWVAAGVAKLADARDSKSRELPSSCGFNSHLRHQAINDLAPCRVLGVTWGALSMWPDRMEWLDRAASAGFSIGCVLCRASDAASRRRHLHVPWRLLRRPYRPGLRSRACSL